MIHEFDALDGIDVASQTQVFAWGIADIAYMAFHSRVEDSFYQARLTAAGNTCDDGHYVEWNRYVDASEVVHPGTLDVDMSVPRTTANGYGDLFLMEQIVDGMASGKARLFRFARYARKAGYVPFEHNLSSEPSGVWPHVYQIICGAHDFFVMLYHYHRVTQ